MRTTRYHRRDRTAAIAAPVLVIALSLAIGNPAAAIPILSSGRLVPPIDNPEQNPAAPEPPKEVSPPPGQAPKPSADKGEVTPEEAIPVLGKKVRGPDGKDVVGSIIDILVDDQGKPRAAIIDFGGFLGVGSRKIAVEWQSLKFRPTDHDAPLVLDLDRSAIQAAPEYKDPTQPAKVVEPPSPAPQAPASAAAAPGAEPAPPAGEPPAAGVPLPAGVPAPTVAPSVPASPALAPQNSAPTAPALPATGPAAPGDQPPAIGDQTTPDAEKHAH